jgi:flavin reductase (DIM6/NTAB) family NADH-FMN oxidoreductase RutF
MAVSGQDLRQVMRRWATGVTVVTTGTGATRHGITVNSFTSLSLDPPLCLVCVDQKARSHEAIPAAGFFAVNLLAEGQEEHSQRFAGRRPELADPFEGLSVDQAPSGAPVFPDCLGYLDCSLYARLPGGDHTIFVGRVEHAVVLSDRPPLIFYGGQYRALARP